MSVLVVYESMYGNTHAVADAIAEGIGGEAEVRSVHDVGSLPADLDLLVVGGPTHMHGLSSGMSRKMSVTAAKEDGHASIEPSATEGAGLRAWLHSLGTASCHAAAFDTRLDRSPHLTGSAARGISRRLRHHGYEVAATASFFVDDGEGPLADGELDRARAWGTELERLVSPKTEQHVSAQCDSDADSHTATD